MRLVVVTGVSGAGKSTALRALEDLGFYAVDNLPLPLVPQLIDLLASRPDIDRAALGIDARSGDFLAGDARRSSPTCASAGTRSRCCSWTPPTTSCCGASPRRAAATRCPTPTSARASAPSGRRWPACARRRARWSTPATLNVHVLRGLIQERYGRGEGELAVTLLSFGFKHGIPAEADIVLDVRFLPNPFFVPTCRRCRARTRRSSASCSTIPRRKAFLDDAERLVQRSVQGFRREGKSYATVAIGCTGGRHRSVAIAKELGAAPGHRAPRLGPPPRHLSWRPTAVEVSER